jgi:catechol 2,3-dioxygenase
MQSERRTIDPDLRIAAVRLAVSDLPRSADFYERVLGLPLISIDKESALLGPPHKQPLLGLRALSHPAPAPPGSTGLFHVAWLHPTRSDLAATVQRIAATRWPIDGAADHGVSEALYLSDPDGLGIEIYVDRPREQWGRPANGQGVEIFTAPLDLKDLLAQAPQVAPSTMPDDSTIGHVHMKVSDVPRTITFYRDALGFEEQARLPSASFLSAGGYHHHVGLNSWQSHGGHPASDSAPGLRLVDFKLSDVNALKTLQRRLVESEHPPSPTSDKDGQLNVRDPDQQSLRFSYS